MSPSKAAREKRNRVTFVGIVAEVTYVLGLSGLCCLVCALVYFAAKWVV